jgi:hypothetical protein
MTKIILALALVIAALVTVPAFAGPHDEQDDTGLGHTCKPGSCERLINAMR